MARSHDDRREHGTGGAENRLVGEARARPIATRVVDGIRARSGDPGAARRPSTPAPAPSRRDATSSAAPTRDQLYAEARARGVKGRSRMTKRELAQALGR